MSSSTDPLPAITELPRPTPTDQTLPAATGASTPAARAAHIPGYEILGELGRGGMGVVYRARHLALNRIVALKMILAGGHAGKDDLARFRSEAEAIAHLQHPNIVQVYEIGEHEGRPFFSLEFCAGGSLERQLTGTPLPPREAAALVETLARAMQAAHENGIIHRDLKPANILLTASKPPATGSVTSLPAVLKITDFGLAKKLHGEPGALAAVGLTQTGAVMGTPSYMAPEQAGGNTRAIGPATDIYALGAILYECLTGRPPFKAATALDTVLQVMDADPVPPSQLQPKIPRDLETICLRCLQKQPGRRYTTAADLADDLQRFQQGEPIAARRVGRVERTAKWVRRRPAVAALVAVVALVGALGLAGIGWAYSLALEERDKFAAERNNAQEAEKHAARDRDLALKAEQKASGERDAADSARKETDKQRKVAEKQLAVARSSLMTSQLLRVASMLPEEPVKGQGLLHDFGACPLDLRDFTWHQYARQANRCRMAVAGAFGAVALSTDGKVIAAARPDKDGVQLLSADNGQEIAFLPASSPQALAFSPDNKMLAIAGKVITLWSVANARQEAALEGQKWPVACLAFSENSALLAAGGGGPNGKGPGELKVWNVSKRAVQSEAAQGLGTTVQCVAFNASGETLVFGAPGIVMTCRTDNGQQLANIGLKDDLVRQVAFHPDRQQVLFATKEKLVTWLPGQGGGFRWIADGRFFAFLHCAAETAWAAGWQNRSDINRGSVACLTIAEASSARSVVTLQESAGTGHIFLEGGAAFSKDGKRLLSWKWDPVTFQRVLEIWDTEVGQEAFSFFLHGPDGPKDRNESIGSAVSPDGSRLAVSMMHFDAANREARGEIVMLDLASGKPLWRVAGKAAMWMCVGLAFSPDGSVLAASWAAIDFADEVPSASAVQLYETAGGKLRATLAEDDTVAASLTFLDDGNLLARCAQARPPAQDQRQFAVLMRQWDLSGGKLRETLEGVHQHPILGRDLGFKAHGRFFVPQTGGKYIEIWDSSGRERHTTGKHQDGHQLLVAVLPDGQGLLTVSGDKSSAQVALWDVASNNQRYAFTAHENLLNQAALSADGRLLATVDVVSGTLKIWDVATGQQRLAFDVGKNLHRCTLAFSRDGRTLIGLLRHANGSETVKVWSPHPRLERAEFPAMFVGSGPVVEGKTLDGRNEPPTVVHAVSPDGRLLVALANDLIAGDHENQAITLLSSWELATGQARQGIEIPGGRIHCLAFRPDSALVAVAGSDKTVSLWQLTTGVKSLVLDGHDGGVVLLRFADEGQTLLAVTRGGIVKRWNVARAAATSFALLDPNKKGRKSLTGDQVAADAAGRLLAVAQAGNVIEFWDVAQGVVRQTVREQAAVKALRLGADGKTLAVILQGGAIHLWDIATGKQRVLAPGDGRKYFTLAFAPDGTKLVAAEVNSLSIWDLKRGDAPATIVGRFNHVSISPDNGSLLATDDAGKVHLWDIAPLLR